MKEKCLSLRISIIIMVVGILTSAILQFVNFGLLPIVQNYLVMLLGGGAASALVTTIIYSTEYRVAKTTTLENYWNEQLKIVNSFLHIDYFLFEIPINLMQSYYSEWRHNKNVEKNLALLKPGQEIPCTDDFCYKYTAKNEWCKLLSDEYKELKVEVSDEDFHNELIKVVERRWSEMNIEIERVLDQYIKFSEVSYSVLENILGQILFFTDIKKCKNSQYIVNEIHYPIRRKLDQIREKVYHFKLYKQGRGNFCVILKILKDLQEDIFLEEVNDNDDYTAINVYAEYHYLMDCKLEDLRANIIYGVEPKHQDKICVLSKINIKK